MKGNPLADAPAVAAAPPQPAPAPPLGAPPNPIPAASSQPSGGAPASPQTPELSLNQRVVVPGPDGREVETTIGEMYTSWKEMPSARSQVDLFQRAFEKNDPAAIQEIVKKYLPAGSPPPPPAPTLDPAVKEAKEQLEALRRQFGEFEPLMKDIRTAAVRSQMEEVITSQKTEHPFLAKHSQRVELLQQRLDHYNDLARSQQIDLATASADIRGKVMKKAMSDVESFLSTTLKELMPPMQPGQPGGPAMPTPVERPANYVFDPNTGQFIKNPAIFGAAPGTQPPAGLPTQPVVPPTGINGSPMNPPAPSANRPFSRDDLVRSMQGRRQVMESTTY